MKPYTYRLFAATFLAAAAMAVTGCQQAPAPAPVAEAPAAEPAPVAQTAPPPQTVIVEHDRRDVRPVPDRARVDIDVHAGKDHRDDHRDPPPHP